MRHEIERHSRKEQCNRKMNQHHVLRMLRENHRFELERMQSLFSLTGR
jgi:hypothetical protein